MSRERKISFYSLGTLQLGHLKRIRSSRSENGGRVLEVILATPDAYSAVDNTERARIEERFSLKPVTRIVPELAPRTRRQFDEGQALWPMLFHHSTSEDALQAARQITEHERRLAGCFMREALRDAVAGRELNGGRPTVGAVIVNPGTEKIVAAAWRGRHAEGGGVSATLFNGQHPLGHAIMLCIAKVGHALLAGKDEGARRGTEADLSPVEEAGGMVGRHSPSGAPATAEVIGVDVLGPQHYLCTGLDVYVTEEPCLMCGMALIHSRVRRVHYGVRDPKRGCLGSYVGLHTLETLNHNYRVFEGILEEECRRSLLPLAGQPPESVKDGSHPLSEEKQLVLGNL
ncbi:unnamed protein product [Discosporangium mesarthrocarpum]